MKKYNKQLTREFLLEQLWERAKKAETPEEAFQWLNVYMDYKEYIQENPTVEEIWYSVKEDK